MYEVYLGISFSKIVPTSLAAALRLIPGVEVRDSRIFLWPLSWPALSECLREVSATGLKLVAPSSYSCYYADPKPYAREPQMFSEQSGIVACVLSAGNNNSEGSPANLQEDFATWHGPPCKGLLKESVPFEVRERPKGLFYKVGDELLFSAAAVKFFDDYAPGAGEPFGDVLWKGKTVPRWTRFRMHNRVSVIDPACRKREMHCRSCGSNLAPAIGVWLALPDRRLSISCGIDEFAFGHSLEAHPLVISNDMALAMLTQNHRREFRLDPIWHPGSSIGHLIRQTADALRNLPYESL